MAGEATDASGLLRDAMDAQGITDNELRAGIAAIAGGESAFKPIAEVGYGHTPNDRIRSIFAAAKHLTDAQLNALKVDDAKFFEAMYGRDSAVGQTLGNIHPGDGYLFRGRGLLQLTGRANYARYGKLTGHPELVTNPELANDPHLAAAIAVAYMHDRYHGGGFDAMKRAVGNSFGNVDDRKNALFRKFLADGTFNAGKPAPAPAAATKGANMADTTNTGAVAAATAALPDVTVHAPTVTQPAVMDWGSVAAQIIDHAKPIAEAAANAGVTLVFAEIPFGSFFQHYVTPKLINQYVDQVFTMIEGSLKDQTISVPTSGIAGMVANAISAAEGPLLDFLNMIGVDLMPQITAAVEGAIGKLKLPGQ